MTDVTNSLNFYVGRSAADVGDMLLHGQIVRECYAQIFCLHGKQNMSVSYLNGGRLGEGLGDRFCFYLLSVMSGRHPLRTFSKILHRSVMMVCPAHTGPGLAYR